MQNKCKYLTRHGGTNVAVRNDDVNGALRRLRKILDKNNRQKDLAKHEFFEKKSISKARAKKSAIKRQERRTRDQRIAGLINDGSSKTNLKYMKSKRKRRVIIDRQNPRQKADSS